MFSGPGRVNLAGAGSNRNRGSGQENRSDFVKRQHKEREARERKRICEQKATVIQAFYRSRLCLNAAWTAQRQVFDKRSGDIAKVGAVLPADKKAKFVFLAIMPMLQPFAFFFHPREDAARLRAIKDLVEYSASQPLASNIFQFAVVDNDAQRASFLFRLQKLMAASLRVGPALDAVRLLSALQAALFPAPSWQPVHETRAGRAVGHLLRHTTVLATLNDEVLCSARRGEPAVAEQAVSLTLLVCAGLETCSWAERQSPLVRMLSTPHLHELLNSGSRSQECLRRLVSLLPGVPAPGTFQDELGTECQGVPRAAWLLENLVSTLERHLAPAGEVEALLLWVDWISWVKDELPGFGAWTAQTRASFYSRQFVRALVTAADRRHHEGRHNTEALLKVCRLYFSTSGAPGATDPPAEVLETLACGFNPPLSKRLFPTIAGLMAGQRISDTYDQLRQPALTFGTPEAMCLRIFCTIYAKQIQPMYDHEFFGSINSLTLQELKALAPFLNRFAYHFVIQTGARGPGVPLAPHARALRTSLTSLVCLLYNRHCRQPILEGKHPWVIPESRSLIRGAPVVDLGADDADDQEPTPMEVEDPDEDEVMDDAGEERSRHGIVMPSSWGQDRGGVAGQSSSQAADEHLLETVLEELPHALRFSDRVQLLQNVILDDMEVRGHPRVWFSDAPRLRRRPLRQHFNPWGPSAENKHRIRRTHLVEDGMEAFNRLSEGDVLREVFRVEFIGSDGEPESGVDGGGLFKEFLISLNRTLFDPAFGLFSETSERTLFPAVGAFRHHERALELFAFLGKVVGKAIYEMCLLEPQFSRCFLNRLLGRVNEVDDLAALDPDLHRNMMNMLKNKESANVDDLSLNFSVSVNDADGYYEEIDLVPNGRHTPVTKDNLTSYFHLLANFKNNEQLKKHTAAFLKGLHCVIPASWVKMFDPYELNVLISGSDKGFDVQDLRENTTYDGGYREDSPVVQWLWGILEHDMDHEDQGRFLMFVTSCSRAPLFGFSTLAPKKFCVFRVPDSDRLPTVSTCLNLLKLPDYLSREALKSKLLMAIRAEAGFDLS